MQRGELPGHQVVVFTDAEWPKSCYNLRAKMPATGRDWRVDALRGYFLATMMVGHLPLNPLQRFVHYPFGFFSSPDGFVFLSGLTCGWVYLRLAMRAGFARLEKRILRRLGWLYGGHILLFAFCLLQPRLLTLPGGRLVYAQAHPLRAWICAALLWYQPRFFDILPMYCVFLLFLPLMLKQLKAHRAWLVLGISAGLWTLAQFGVGDRSTVLPWMDLGAFNLFAWQGYFVAGLYLGHRKVQDRDGVVPRSWCLFALSCTVVAFLFVSRHQNALLPESLRWARIALLPSHNPIRFLNFACAAYVFSFIPRKLDEHLQQWRMFRFFSLLGQYSLAVFSWSIFVSLWAFVQQSQWEAAPATVRLAMALFAVLLLAVPALINEECRKFRRARIKYLPAPVPLRSYSATTN